MAASELVIGSRGGRLALWQTNHVRGKLLSLHPGLEVRVRVIRTRGDKITDVALSKIGGKGLFTKELEDAVLAGRVDLAVHSLKDLPTELPPGLEAGIITERLYAEDALVSRDGQRLKELVPGSRVGTSSLRRKAQLLAARPDLVCLDLRGNLDTRLEKLDRGDKYEAILVARAGLERLGLGGRISEALPVDLMTPAAGQGALALEYRQDESHILELISPLAHERTTIETAAEREFLSTLGGGCQVPAGVSAVLDRENGMLSVLGMISDLEGANMLRDRIEALPSERPGRALAQRMLDSGGREILEA